MNNFKKDGFRKGGSGFGGKQSFGGPKRFGGSDRGGARTGFNREGRSSDEKELFKATCSSCHKSCEVPFRPSGEKPVYCRECYRDNSQSDTRASQHGGGRGDTRNETRSFREERPAYREEVRALRDTGTEDIKRQLIKLEAKVDSIIAFMSSQILQKQEVKSAPLIVETVVTETAPKKVRKQKTEKVTTKAKASPKKKAATKKAS